MFYVVFYIFHQTNNDRWASQHAKHSPLVPEGRYATRAMRDTIGRRANDNIYIAMYTIGSDHLARDSLGSLLVKKNENYPLEILRRKRHVSRNHMNPNTKTPRAPKPN